MCKLREFLSLTHPHTSPAAFIHTFFSLFKAMPLHQIPLLEIGDKKFVQSASIGRYLAKKVGLTGANDLEDLEIDGVVDTVAEFMLSEEDFETFLSN